jgi:PhnB protein
MSVKILNPYINFNGTAAKAIQLYESALGAKVESVMRYGETPGMNAPPEQKDLILHAALQIGGGVLMMTDGSPHQPVATESNVHVALHLTDVAEAEKAFQALSAGGKVIQPLQDTFWGAKFGTLTDAYGVHWMFNCELNKDELKKA